MLSPLPDRVDFGRQLPNTPAPAHYTLVPATQIPDSDAAMLTGEYVFDVCRRARISRRRAGYIAAAAMELADNAVIHAPEALDAPVLAVNSVGRARVVELAVTDAGTTVSDADDPITIVRGIPGRAIAGEPGFLGQILRRGRQAGLDVTVEVLTGVAHLTWTTTRHRTTRTRYVPGMTVVARIGT
jgi:anti-sigma regulatory factor (Ser/Thr protein kinase)